MTNPILDHLLSRRSVSAAMLAEPGPTAEQLTQILTAAARVPDHKKLAPWRFILFQGEARASFGQTLARIFEAKQADATDARIAFEGERFMRAPLVVAVISQVVENAAAPAWEQELSAGAVCMNLLHAATALGFGAQWITEWCAFDPEVAGALGLAGNERVAGFVYIGTATEKPDERDRPRLEDIVTAYRG
ncbi:putative NAD(P)H nitroreductase YdjA [Methyloligella halotolerans]|uniref:Putative NAD(P)H nitroreductase n=1 Tax=Methyloligella halotolerans TaxID=1177755 RepID=A0A1E2S1E3_9HYPH|nr:nitroreductase [Methyloligella halotolerans]ODA68220.1 putative NAD(P)H nitroreductase YdjA [Methyloligella halotolerans]